MMGFLDVPYCNTATTTTGYSSLYAMESGCRPLDHLPANQWPEKIAP